jgi:tetratricopeptide (TPR) repeat protein
MTDISAQLAAALRDRYALEREVGAGGMALVYLARDLRHHRLVAIKVLRPELAVSLASERFLREIEVAAGLQHPHIVPLYDSGAGADGILYYVMPYVEGESLRDRLRREPRLPVGEATRLTLEIASALECAHGHGVVHRDIKPENVLLSGGHALVADFGVARAINTAAERTQLTDTGLAIGTPLYMSPEQATASHEVDARSDQYALTCVLYEMLAGEPPFAGSTPQAIVTRSLTAPRPHLRALRGDVPASLDDVVTRGLAREPAERFPSITEFSEAIAQAAAGAARGAASSPRRRAAVAVGAILLAAAGGALTWFATRTPPPVARGAETIAVLPFRTAGPGVELMGEGMVDLLARNLDQVGSIRTVDPRTVLSRWRKQGAAQGDLGDAVAVGRAVGAGSVLTGSVVAAGSRVRLSADLRSLTGAELAQAQVEGPADSVLPLVDGLSLALLRSVWRSDEPIPNLRVAAITTRSPDALRAYLQGEQYYRQTRWDSALAAYDRAVESDSTFALAHFRRALVIGWTGGYGSEKSLAASAAGFRFANRLPERDRALLVGYRLFERGKPAAVDTLRRYVADYPDDVEGWYLLGEALFHTQAYTATPPDSSRAAFDSVLRRDSSLTPALLHPLEITLRSRDSLGYWNYIKRFTPLLGIGDEKAAVGSAGSEMVWGQEISDSAIRVITKDGPLGSVMQSLNDRPEVTSDFIVRTGARVQAAMPTPAKRKLALEKRASATAGLGRFREASRLADSLAMISPGDALVVSAAPVVMGLAPPEFGGPRVAAWLRTPPRSSEDELYRAIYELSQGQLPAARRRIDAALTVRDTIALPPNVRGSLLGARGWASLMAGDTAAGLADLRRALNEAATPHGELMTAPWRFQLALALAARPETRAEGIRWLRYGFDHPLLIPLTYLALGRAYRAAGDRQAAALAYGRVVRLWDKAEPPLQSFVREARAALEELTAEQKP